MKLSWFRFLLIGLCSFFVVSLSVSAAGKNYAPFPTPDAGYVSDHADLLSARKEVRLESMLDVAREKTGVEIVVVSIKSIYDYVEKDQQSIDTFAAAMFEAYGVGNRPKNDGVLFLVSIDDRELRIKLGRHYGILRDDDAGRIMQDVVLPQFKNGDYAAGITEGAEAIIEEFAYPKVVRFPWHLAFFAAAAFISLAIVVSFINNGKRGWGYVFVGFIIIFILLVLFIPRQFFKGRSRVGEEEDYEGDDSSGGGGTKGNW